MLALLLWGCASWYHPTKTAEEFQQDQYACERDAAPVQNPYRAIVMQQRCMEARGWELRY